MRFEHITRGVLLIVALTLIGVTRADTPPTPPDTLKIDIIATGLRNPRGVAVMPDGRLLVAEAGMGAGVSETGGHLRVFSDLDGDGAYHLPEEREMVMCCVAGYNALTYFGTGQDEVGGLGGVILLEDGRVFYTQDDPVGAYVADGRPRGVAVFGLTPEPEWRRFEVAVRNATMNALTYDPVDDVLYVIESGLNRLSRFALDGTVQTVTQFGELEDGQQAVPAGIARDPRNGDLLVALFSGQIRDYYGTLIAYMPEAARVVRVNPNTGEWQDEIIGLTTAVDVAIDPEGNLYVVELATGWASAVMPRAFPLYDEDAPPDAGGYPRFTGRVSMYPADGGAPVYLATGLDAPTNITYHDGVLYVSAGQGTPNRPIIAPEGRRTRITGELYRITGFK